MTPIKEVIEQFQKALIAYESALSKKTISFAELREMSLESGICIKKTLTLFY